MVKVSFFPCYYCHAWRYSLKRKGKVKCLNLNCGKMIDIEKAVKQEYKLRSIAEAPKIIQKIKERTHKER